MDSTNISTLSFIIKKQRHLDKIIRQLLAQCVARSDIAVHGNTNKTNDANQQVKASFSASQHHDDNKVSIEQPYLKDDYGWAVGFSFSIPLFVCLVISVFILGDIQSNHDILVYGLCGLAVGTVLGLAMAFVVHYFRKRNAKKQEQQGGYLVSVTLHNDDQQQGVQKVLHKNRKHVARVKLTHHLSKIDVT